jgi:Na+-driven multidrug efflux pump/anti-sigma regulatory factor (Ser/Thr protein kinase)
MGAINTIVDGAMAGRYIDSSAVGVVGLYYSMVEIMTAVGSVLLGGTAVLCGRYMGRGESKKTEGIFSLNLTVTFIFGLILTLVSFIIPGPLAALLGANQELKAPLVSYIVGYGVGILPMLFAQQLADFLQMERQSVRGYVGIAGMIISNVVLDILLVAVLDMGIFGLALATSLSNLIYFLLLVPYYFTKRAKLHYSFNNILWQDLGNMLKIGFPGAMLIFCIALRYMVINRLLLHYVGGDGLSAMSSFNMVCGIFIAYCLGNGAIVRMLISIFVGEEDKNSMKKTLQLVFTKGLLLSVVVGAVIFAISPMLTGIFFPDRASNVYHLAYQLFAIYSVCIPLILICQILTNYLQATGHNFFVNIQSIFDGFFAIVIPAAILAPVMGALGVWISNPIGIILTILTAPVYAFIYWRHFPKNLDEWMFLSPDFGVAPENVLDIPIYNYDDVSDASARIQEFCADHGMEKRSAYYSALCLEELAGNVVKHGFTADKKKHFLSVMTLFLGEKVILRLKDDCVPFDPVQMAEMTSDKGGFDNMGIRMVYRIASDVSYQNMLGMNVLTVTIGEKNLIESQENDFLLEKRLRDLDRNLHQKFKDSVFASGKVLTRYRRLFPEYTDHSELHSMTVIDSCNRLIGSEQIERLNKDEIYCLLMACYLHDSGMGISEKDYEESKDRFGEKEFFAKHPGATTADFVRVYHNDFSGFFIDKYADVFEIPSPEHVFAIKQIARGHRKTDLYDEKEYPAEFKVPGGNTICLPYLAALIRLSDEVDVVATRNPLVLYDIDALTDEVEIVENKKVNAIKSMIMTGSAYVLYYVTAEKEIESDIREMSVKMQKTLDYCRAITEKRSDFKIRQKKIILKKL